jgi:hypothetical protein
MKVKEGNSTNESEKVSGNSPVYVVPCRRNLKNKFK